MFEIDTVIISTVIALVVSVTGSFLSYFFSTKKAEQDARRDYQYDARKRLYEEYEPLVFQLHELCETAYNRIANLAENLRDGRLKVDSGWLGDPNNEIYFANTIYRLIAPLAIFKLMELRLTTFDLALEAQFKNEYLFAKALYHVFRRDHWFANPNTPPTALKSYSKIDYDPHNNPEKYKEQVIHLAQIDKMAAALLKSEPPDKLRLMSFPEFSGAYFDDKTKGFFIPVTDLFLNFHPIKSPVLWRILMAYAYICRAISTTPKEKDVSTILTNYSVPTEDYKQFYWYMDEQADMDSKTQENFKIAEKYLRERLTGPYGMY